MATKHLEARVSRFSSLAWCSSIAPATISRVPLSSVYTCREWCCRLSAQASHRDVSSVRFCGEPAGAVRRALGCESETPTVKVVDTTSDTTEDATCRNSGQPLAKKSAYLSRFLQPTATLGNTCQRIVAPKGAGSSPVGHPLSPVRRQQISVFCKG